MDVYGDSPTIVTVWLTVLPKLSILILLLELYLQIVGFENFFTAIPYEYFVNFNHLSELPYIVSQFLDQVGGYNNYVEIWLANPHLNLTHPDEFFELGIKTIHEVNISDIQKLFNITSNDIYWNYFLNPQTFFIEGSNMALNNLLFISSLLSLIIGTVLGLAQSQIKRLLAYT